MAKEKPKLVMRRLDIPETDWKWLCQWLEALLKTVPLEDMSRDTLMLGGILEQLKMAERLEDKKTTK